MEKLNLHQFKWFGILLSVNIPAGAQPFLSYGKDSVKVPAGSVIYYEDREVRAISDTFVLVPAKSKYTIAPFHERKQAEFFDSLQSKAGNSKWTSRLHNIILKSPRNTPITDTLATERASDVFMPYAGRVIRTITIKQLPPFGPSIHDTSAVPSTRLEQTANELHQSTHINVIRNSLLFKAGQGVDPLLLGDNERVIRTLPFIEDARIYINQNGPPSDSVDITILVKDAFSYGAGGAISDLNAGNLEVFNSNLFGLGQEFHLRFLWDTDHQPWLGNEYLYKVNNIAGSFVDSKIRYLHTYETETFQAGLDRKFFTPNTRYAGALNFERTATTEQVRYSDTMVVPTPLKFNRYDAWAGRSIYLSSRKKLLRNRTNLVVSARFYEEHYFDRPEVTDSIFYQYHNKDVLLFSLSLSQHSFFKSNLIYSFGRTEDIQQGMLIGFTTGPEFSEFNTRWYTGLELSKGGYLGNLGYLYGLAAYGGFIEKFNLVEQGVIHTQLDFFSNLYIVNRFKFRHFLKFDYLRGIRRLEDDMININDRNGIRGFKYEGLQGSHRLIMRYETVAFSPYYFYGFRFAFFGFTDLGLIGPDTEPILNNRLHSGIGFGIRFKNERLVFETIQVRIGYYPTLSDIEFPFSLDLSGEKRLNPKNFFVTRPRIIGF